MYMNHGFLAGAATVLRCPNRTAQVMADDDVLPTNGDPELQQTLFTTIENNETLFSPPPHYVP